MRSMFLKASLWALTLMLGTFLMQLQDAVVHWVKLGFDNPLLTRFYKPEDLIYNFLPVLILMTAGSRKYLFFWLAAFSLPSLLQLVGLAYFGTFVGSADLLEFIAEPGEVFRISYLRDVYYVPLIWFGCWFSIYKLMMKASTLLVLSKKRVIHGALLTLICISFVSLGVKGRLSPLVRNDFFKSSLFNGYVAFTSPLFDQVKVSYPEQTAHLSRKLIKNVVLVIGESCSSDHMSLYGYERDTTPWLSSQKESSSFLFRKGLAASPSTFSSMQFLLNLSLLPGDHAFKNKDYKSNLIRLAKQNGYNTYLLSLQRPRVFCYAGLESLDYFSAESFSVGTEELLLEKLNRIDLGESNFIILHQRNLHSPYKEHYAHMQDRFTIFPDNEVVDHYDNAMAYYDYSCRQIVETVEHILPDLSEYCIIFTSDHGEAVQKKGRQGHNFLDEELSCLKVPFMVFHNIDSATLLHALPQREYITHYEVGRFTAKCLGYDIENSLYSEHVDYIKSNDLNGGKEFLEIGLTAPYPKAQLKNLVYDSVTKKYQPVKAAR